MLGEKIVQAQRSSRQRKREEGYLVVALFFMDSTISDHNQVAQPMCFSTNK